MKFGYFTLTDNAPAYGDRRREPGTFIREVLEECVEAEAMGFNSAWVPEHHLGAFGVLPSPWILLAVVVVPEPSLRQVVYRARLPGLERGMAGPRQ